MKLVVHDASILIDLALSDMVNPWFSTGIETWTSGLIFPNEITEDTQRRIYEEYVKAGALKVRHFKPGKEVETLVTYQANANRGLSLADVSVCLLTKELGPNTVLATGDKSLRRLAEKEKICACGVLKLWDHMVDGIEGAKGVLHKAVAAERLARFMQHPGCRLPTDKCFERLGKWGRKK